MASCWCGYQPGPPPLPPLPRRPVGSSSRSLEVEPTLMSRMYTTHRRLCSRWFLIWLLPYVVLSVSGGGIHNHGKAGLSSQVNDRLAEGTAPVSLAPTTPASDDDCAACQWLAGSTAQAPTQVAVSDSGPVAIAAPALTPSLPVVFLVCRDIRAPPSA